MILGQLIKENSIYLILLFNFYIFNFKIFQDHH
jgi:hypothetical protein